LLYGEDVSEDFLLLSNTDEALNARKETVAMKP
jgi:hypothetical protein